MNNKTERTVWFVTFFFDDPPIIEEAEGLLADFWLPVFLEKEYAEAYAQKFPGSQIFSHRIQVTLCESAN